MSGSGRRFAGVVLTLLAASVGVLVAFGATWVVAQVPVFAGADSGAGREVALTGRDLVPLGSAMGWVGLAAIAALLATRTWGRRVTGAVVVLGGGVAGASAVAFGLSEAASGGSGSFVSAALAGRGEAAAITSTVTGWWLLGVAAGLAMLICGMLALLDGPAWPRLGARYSRDEARGGASRAAAWDALDRGEDPTEASDETSRGTSRETSRGGHQPDGAVGDAPGSMGPGAGPSVPRSEEE